MDKKNPFMVPAPPLYRKYTDEIQYCTVEEWMRMLKGFNLQQLHDAILWPGTQLTVRKAAERMLQRRMRGKRD